MPIAPASTRCPGCGKHVPASIRPPSPDGSETSCATDGDRHRLENNVLLAASGGDNRIYAFRSSASDAEIKAGEMRVAGEEALSAVRSLLEASLIEPVDESSFVLTAAGRRAARVLQDRRD